jgi:hypothetical protein
MSSTTHIALTSDQPGTPPIGTSAGGCRGMLALSGVAWLAWIGFLVFVLMSRA